MKKITIATAFLLTTAVTAFSLAKKDAGKENISTKTENTNFGVKDSSAPKSDIATAD
jgi:hypothetical protein